MEGRQSGQSGAWLPGNDGQGVPNKSEYEQGIRLGYCCWWAIMAKCVCVLAHAAERLFIAITNVRRNTGS